MRTPGLPPIAVRALMFAVSCALFASSCSAQPSEALLDAIRVVESSGRCSGAVKDGDGGRSIGVYQISRAYWLDAVKFDPRLARKPYAACRTDAAYAREVVRAYLTRYGAGKSDSQMARIHNGGPRGDRKKATVGYAGKVERAKKANGDARTANRGGGK